MQAQRFRVGNIDVLGVADGSIAFPAKVYFANTTDEQWVKHSRWLDHAGNVTFPFGCFLVRAGGRTLLIDTGVGPVAVGVFKGGALLGELRAAGVAPEDIDIVFMTHLHLDHCGSAALPAADGGLAPAFPRATYRWTSDEQAYWSGTPERRGSRPDVLAAVAGRWQAADGGTALMPGVEVLSMPGHTPGHAGVVISSDGERAFILGDGIACPAQLEEPEWSGLGDIDPKLARRAQESVAREAEGGGALFGASHFPGLMLGRVLRGQGTRYWEPARPI